MVTDREIMHVGAQCVGANDTLEQAARLMKELGVGALPICGEDDRLQGIITDRDIVVKCIAAGGDPRAMKAGGLAQGKPVTIDAESDLDEVLDVMKEHQIRRLPVTDNKRLVGMISEADLGQSLTEEEVGYFVEAVYADRA